MTAMTTLQHSPDATATRKIGKTRARGLLVGGAVLATSTLYLTAGAAGVDFSLTDPGKTQHHALILPEIAVFTLVFALLGWGTLALLEHWTRRAAAIWTALATAVLLLSFVPIGLETATAGTKIMLTVIHVTVAAALVPMLRHTAART